MSLLTMFGKANLTEETPELVFAISSEGFNDSTKLLTPSVTPSETPTMERNVGSRYPELDGTTLNGYPIIEMYDGGASGQAFVLPSDFDIALTGDALLVWSLINSSDIEYALSYPFDLRKDAGNTTYRLILQAPPNVTGKDAVRYYYNDSEGVNQNEAFLDLGAEYDLTDFHVIALHISGETTKLYIDGDLVGEGAIYFSDGYLIRSSVDLGRQTCLQHIGNGITKWVELKIWTKDTALTVDEINERANEIATKYGLTWNDLAT